MGKSQGLRLREVRAAFRLVGECRELGGDAFTWRRQLAAGARTLLGAGAVVSGEGTADEPRVWVHEGVGEDQMAEFFRGGKHGRPSAAHSPMVQRFPRLARLTTRRREQLVPDREWYPDAEFNEVFRPGQLDGGLLSFYPLPDGLLSAIIAHPELGRRLGPRDSRLVQILHGEVGPLVGRALAGSWEPGVAGLAPRVRQVLDCLLDGDGEKQVAWQLGISSATVHDYVKVLHRHYGVNTRAELMAHFLRRHRGGRPDPPAVS